MFKVFFKIIIFVFFYQLSALSENYNNILIKGNDRVSDETILIFADIPPETSLNNDLLNSILKKIYRSNFFKDVVVKIENNNLLIEVKENPIIQTLFIEGVNAKKIKKNINDILLLKDRSPFISTFAQNDETSILNLLRDDGYFFSSVNTTIEMLNNNKINLTYNITLGDKAKISKISFLGDKKFKDRVLRDIIISQEYKFWKIVSGGKFLNEKIVNYDKRLLKNFYKNSGFYNVTIESSFANYLGNNEFELIYNIVAGNKHFFNDLSLKLPSDYNPKNFNELILKFDEFKGKKYSLNAIEMILSEIDKIVLNEQFEFLNASVIEDVKDNKINLTFNIQETDKLYVEKINIFGNNITQENVIRNNFLVDEGEAFNELLFKKSINNLKSLNIFGKVNSEILTGSSNSQKIIDITVDEKATGEISAGAGFGTNGASVGFGVKENNFLGKGINFGTDLILSEESIKGKIFLVNPNYKGSNRSLNLSAENNTLDRLKDFGYKSSKAGLDIGTGYEYYDDLFFNTGISSYVEKLETDATASANMKKQKGSYFDTFFNYTINYDKRNQSFKPTSGFKSIFTQNIPLISETFSLSNTYDYKIYKELFEKNITSLGFYISSTNSISGKNIKLSDRLFVPSNKLRGFAQGKIGPKDGEDYIGGNHLVTFNASSTLPQILPNIQNTDFSIFYDAAHLWGTDYNTSLSQDNKLRSSIGIAVDVFTPIGPLNFSFTEVISKDSKDTTESFRFNLGTTF